MSSNASKGAGQANILVVDDTPANLQVLAGMLKERGYRVRPALSGKLALQGAQAEPPDLILLDLNMPEMNGYQVCERLKADEKLREVPVIFISALSETLDKVKAFSSGGVDYITKPFQLEEVEARVRTHLAIRQQQHRLRENYEKLRELEALRDNLVHMIVHDIRNSLTVIRGNLELMRSSEQDRFSSYGRECADEALSCMGSLVEMTSSLLDVSKMESGEMKLNLSECDLLGIVKDTLKKLEPLKGARRLSVNPPEGRITVEADPVLLARVTQNLLDNALKYTPATGEIRIAVEAGQGRVRFSVQDTGPGIPAEYHKRIFEKFGQVGDPAADHRHSTGLGLTFCKMAIEAHGGEIGVDSAVNQGSTFWFVLGKRSQDQTAGVGGRA